MIDSADRQAIATVVGLFAMSVVSVLLTAVTLGAAYWIFVEVSGV